MKRRTFLQGVGATLSGGLAAGEVSANHGNGHWRHAWWFDGPSLEVSIYSTRKLRKKHGRKAERSAAKFLSECLKDHNFNHRIRVGYPVQDPPGEASVCSSDNTAFKWWRSQVNGNRILWVARDSNILLTSATAGGCGAVGGKVATAPGGGIHVYFENGRRIRGRYKFARNISAVLHEFCHNCGISHDQKDHVPGRQSTGAAWVDNNGNWHRTPQNNADDVTNACGRDIPAKPWYADTVYELWFTRCTRDRIQDYLRQR